MKIQIALYLLVTFCAINQLVCENCPGNTPIRCPDNSCVLTYSQCPPNLCSGSTPYLCSDGSCSADSSHCNCIGVLCVDGSCKPTIEDCPILASCPNDNPLRCPNGACYPYNYDCTNAPAPVCDVGLIPCIDGICRTQAQCNNLPHNGCPVFQCPDATCTDDFNDCLCGVGLQKCWDQSCVPVGTICAVQPPSEVEPMNITTTVNSNATTTAVSPQSNNATQTSIKITLQPNTFLNNTGLTTKPVAGSTTKKTQVTAPTGNTESPKIVSSVVNVTTTTGQTNFTNNATIEFESNVSNVTVENGCVATLIDNNWICTNGSTVSVNNGTLTATTETRHFSIYAVIDAPMYKCTPACPEDECEVEVYDLKTATGLLVGWVEVKNKLAHEISLEFFTFEDRNDYSFGWQLNSLIINVGAVNYKNSFSERYREFVAIDMEDAFPPRGKIKCDTDVIQFFGAASVFDDGPCPPNRNEPSCPTTYHSAYLVPRNKRQEPNPKYQSAKSKITLSAAMPHKRNSNSHYPDVSNPGPYTYSHRMCCPCDYRAEKQADFGRDCNSQSTQLGCYLASKFHDCYPIGLDVGCSSGGNKLHFDSASDVQVYLDRANQPANKLIKSYTNPLFTESGKLGGAVTALALSDRLDRCDNNWAGTCNWLNSLYICPPENPSDNICSAYFTGYTIKDLVQFSNNVLGGCQSLPSGLTYDGLAKCLDFIGINLSGGRRPEEFLHRGIKRDPC